MRNLEDAFEPALVASLKTMLGQLPKQTPQSVQHSTAELLEIADAYRASFSLLDAAGRRSRPSLAESRQAMKKLAKLLDDANEVFGALPVTAKQSFATAAGAPLGPLAQSLAHYSQAAHAALESLLKQANKPSDDARTVLALQVALVFRDTLGLKATTTRINSINVTGTRGGASYARVLSITLALAGWPNVSLGPLIDSGLELLGDKALPHNVP
jgi:hypothetical protein